MKIIPFNWIVLFFILCVQGCVVCMHPAVAGPVYNLSISMNESDIVKKYGNKASVSLLGRDIKMPECKRSHYHYLLCSGKVGETESVKMLEYDLRECKRWFFLCIKNDEWIVVSDALIPRGFEFTPITEDGKGEEKKL